jgi:quercetin dioxygenase-like cupin family protein
MKPKLTATLVTATVVLAVAHVASGQPHGEEAGMAALHLPSAIQWKPGPPSVPPGAQFVVLEGDPTKEGPFTMRLKLPDGYRIPPHTHPKVERLTVISGTFNLGMGETFDAKATRAMPAGSYGYWPAGMKHFVWAKGETVVQVHGAGPWQIVYLNPADDPRSGGGGREAESGRRETPTLPASRLLPPASRFQIGDRVESFMAVALSGQFRGKQLSFVEAFGQSPVVLAFSRDTREGTAALGARLQRLEERYRPRGLRTCLVYLGGPEAEEMLDRLVSEEGLTLPVCLLLSGPDQKDLAPYRIAPEARNTVILYRRQKVRQTFVNLDEKSFPELSAATEKVVKEAGGLPRRAQVE